MQLLQFPAELISYKTYATKQNVTVNFELQEALEPESLAKLIGAKGLTGWLLFSPNQKRVELSDIPTEPVRENEQKTPSQRLRAVLFILHKETKRTDSFDRFYEDYMNRLIDTIKEKLPPQE